MLTKERAEQIAQAWIDAWNSHDLERILKHYSDQIEFTSPVIVKRLGEPTGRISNKEVLAHYFEGALDAYSDLRFDLAEVYIGVNSIVIHYHSQVGNQIYTGSEMMVLDESDRATLVYAHYDRER